jgi:alpha-L-rhamnosidase
LPLISVGQPEAQPDPRHSGFKHFFLAPQFPAGHPKASAAVATAQGDIVSAWKREGDSILWNVTVPWNTTATVKLPDGRTEEIAAGKHHFTIK